MAENEGKFEVLISRQFVDWLGEQCASLVFTTYQVGKLFSMLWLVAAVVPGMQIGGFGAALLGSLLLTMLNLVIDRLTRKS